MPTPDSSNRRLAGPLSLLLCLALAGMLLGAIDAARALRAGAGLSAAGGLWLIGAFAGILPGLLGALVLLAGRRLHARLRGTPIRRPDGSGPDLRGGAVLFWTFGVISLAALLFILAFPVPERDRRVFLEDSLVASRVARALWRVADRDGDGYSPLLGGGDCDDANPGVAPGALDLTANGVDEDCDGADPTSLSGLIASAYLMDRDTADAIARKAARFPTLLIAVDALRGDRLAMGPRHFPNLSALASQSIRFERAYSHAASTRRAVPAILTGRVLPRAFDPTLPMLLRKAGLRTAVVTPDVVPLLMSGGFPGDRAGFPFLRGFDVQEIVETSEQELSSIFNLTDWTATEVTDRVLALLESQDPPDFIWIQYYALNQWTVVEHEAIEAEGIFRYDDVLRLVGAEINRILRAHGDRVNVILLGTHGDSLMGLFQSGRLSVDLVHVPLLVRVPGVRPRSVAAPVGLARVLATVLDLTGSPRGDPRSPSVLGLVGAERPATGHPILMAEANERALALGRWRLRYVPRSGSVRLFDTVTDAAEKNDVAGTYPGVTKRLLELLERMYGREATRQAGQF